jgi:hypothetical protein
MPVETNRARVYGQESPAFWGHRRVLHRPGRLVHRKPGSVHRNGALPVEIGAEMSGQQKGRTR